MRNPSKLIALLILGGCGGEAAGNLDGGAGDGGPVPTALGFVTLTSNTEPPSLLANASFLPAGPAFLCTEITYGPCTFFSCVPRQEGGADAVPSAGAIDIGGGDRPLRLSPDSDGFYDPVREDSAFFSGGEMLTATAVGAGVPAFSIGVEAPSLVSISSPVPSAGDWPIDRTQDLSFTWSGTSERLIITFGSNSVDPLEVECSFPGNAGSGTIPAAALSRLPAGGGYYEVNARAAKQVIAGSWQMTFRVDSAAITATGTAFNGGAEFL